MANPYFNPTYSTFDIWRADNMQICLEDELATIEADVASKAATDHTHSGYATSNHTHNGYANANHTHSNYSPSTHTHSDYAATTHTHTIATSSTNGLMSATDKVKFDGMVLATVSEVETYLSI